MTNAHEIMAATGCTEEIAQRAITGHYASTTTPSLEQMIKRARFLLAQAERKASEPAPAPAPVAPATDAKYAALLKSSNSGACSCCGEWRLLSASGFCTEGRNCSKRGRRMWTKK